jgi:protocatechuate 3,4-dioxygenase beta subunit
MKESWKGPRVSRRKLLALGALGGAAWVGDRVAEASSATPEQTEGPFFPDRKREDEDADLTRVKGRSGRAAGDVIVVRGQILDEGGKPIEGALVEVWQANKYGRYEHERDEGNPRPLDPNFQGWARLVTGPEGRFGFQTIRPGSYDGDGGGEWQRPPHIHFKVSRRGFHELTTQMYFAGDDLNQRDRIYRSLSKEEQAQVTVAFAPAKDLEKGARLGRFDITMRQVT